MLSGPVWSAFLYSQFLAKGYTGASLLTFATAIGTGSVNSITGKSFTTADTGTVTGTGSGTGTGLIVSDITSSLFSKFVSKGYVGSQLLNMCSAISTAFVSQCITITLTSSHTSVFSGSGSVIASSIPVTKAQWMSNMILLAPTFLGPDWIIICDVIGDVCSNELKSSTGLVTITGSVTIPPPIPGSGSGSGSLS